jgi:membrane peptidoglycan carboxypeptidase
VAAITVVEPGTGLVKAMAQSKPYGKGKNQTAYNYNVEKSYPGGYGGFQIGSTAKALTIAAAIQKGMPLSHRINSPAQIDLSGRRYSTCTGSMKTEDDYRPKNSTAAKGNLTMLDAARASTNTYFLQLAQQVGLCSIATIGKNLGLYDAQTGNPLGQVPSITLGVDYMSPLMLSNAYAAFAARGKYCQPVVVTAVLDKAGKPIKTPGTDCKQVLEPAIADGVNRVLGAVMEPGGTGARLRFGSWDLAGKTGTITRNLAVWYSGYTPNLAAAAVVADVSPPYWNLIGQRLNGKRISDASGSGTAGPLWRTAMEEALEGMPLERFVPPSDEVIRGDVKDLPAVNGMSVEEATDVLRLAGFEVAVSTERRSSEEAEGTVAYTDPRRRDGAPEGSTVTLYISNGRGGPREDPTLPPTVPPPPGGGQATRPPKPRIPCPPSHPQFPNCRNR